MKRPILKAWAYGGLCLALSLAGVQLVVAESPRGKVQPVPQRNTPEFLAQAQPTPEISTDTRDDESVVRLISASDNRIVLAVSAGDLSITEVTLADGSTCQEITLPGYQSLAISGYPALPATGAALGIPIASAISVRIVDSEATQLPGVYNLCPEPGPILDISAGDELATQVVGWERNCAPDAYNTDAWMPTDPVEVTNTGFIRDQRIAELAIRPLQYNPVSSKVRLFTHLTVEVRFDAVPSAPTTREIVEPATAVQPFDTLLRSYLLNYDQAKAWRKDRSLSASDELTARFASAAADTGTPLYRIEIRDAGLYQLSFAELQAADPSVDLSGVDPRTFHLSTHGQEVAIEVTGQSDGVFDPTDTLYFFAEPINTVYAGRNVYWLKWDEALGLRMVTLSAAPTGAAPLAGAFTTTLQLEEDRTYRRALVTADGDNWFWSDLQSTGTPISVPYTFTIPNLATTSAQAIVTGDLLGYSASPNHSGELYLNGHLIYTATWPARTEHQFTVGIPHAYLTNGTNVLSVTVGVGVSNTADHVLVNSFSLTHAARYSATNDQLWFDGDDAGTWEFLVSGFSAAAVKILDITDATTPAQIVGGPAQFSGLTYALPFEQSLNGERHYYAVATAQVPSPASISRDAVSDLHSSSNAADYIVIAHSSLIPAAQSLVDHRAAQGLRSRLVDVQDIYDAFNFGIPDAAAIRDFLAYAYANWTPPAPSYVVLFGDGHYDAKDNLDRGEPSLIPPYLAAVDPWIRETAADNRYVTIDGDTLPDMFLGRLPANTPEQAATLVDKIIAYERPSAAGAWQSKLLFVADNEDTGGDFAVDSDAIADHFVPAPYTVDKVYLGITHDAVTAPAATIAAINQGRLIVNYAGHGSTQLWASERLLSVGATPALTNASKLPFFVPMTCLEGYFILSSPPAADYAALAETLVRLPTGGAIASWSATGLGLASGHNYLNHGLFEAIFDRDIVELGPATTYAKQFLAASSGGIYFRDLLDTYTLFGDPALRLAVLADVQIDKRISASQAQFETGDLITYTLTFSNAGSAIAYDVVITDVLPAALTMPSVLASGAAVTPRMGSTLVWDVADLYPGSGGIITLTGIVSVTSSEQAFANTAMITTSSLEEDVLDNISTVYWNGRRTYLPLIVKANPSP